MHAEFVLSSAKIYNSDETAKGNAIFIPEKDTNALQCYGVTVQIRLYHTSKNNPISLYIYIYRDIEVFYTPLATIFGTVTP